MRIVIAGAGAIGGYIGARLAKAGADVVLFARGPHLKAMQERGLRVQSAEGDFEVGRRSLATSRRLDGRRRVSWRQGARADGTRAGTAAAVRAGHGRRQHAERHPVVVLPEPWRRAQRPAARTRRPGGVIAGAIEPRRVLGSLAYFATDIVEPGVIRHIEGNRLSFGEPDGSKSDRAENCRGADRRGFSLPGDHAVPPRDLGEAARQRRFNPISALTRGTLEELVRKPDTSRGSRHHDRDGSGGQPLGIELPISIDQRIAGAEKVGAHKTSMLQDLEAGRPMEIEAVVGATSNWASALACRCRRREPSTRA